MNNHPNRNWRKRWHISGQSATHASGLTVTALPVGEGLRLTLQSDLPAVPQDTQARLLQSRQVARCCEEGLRLLLESLSPCPPR